MLVCSCQGCPVCVGWQHLLGQEHKQLAAQNKAFQGPLPGAPPVRLPQPHCRTSQVTQRPACSCSSQIAVLCCEVAVMQSEPQRARRRLPAAYCAHAVIFTVLGACMGLRCAAALHRMHGTEVNTSDHEHAAYQASGTTSVSPAGFWTLTDQHLLSGVLAPSSLVLAFTTGKPLCRVLRSTPSMKATLSISPKDLRHGHGQSLHRCQPACTFSTRVHGLMMLNSMLMPLKLPDPVCHLCERICGLSRAVDA